MRVTLVAGTEERHLWLTRQPRVLSTGCNKLNDTTRHLQWREKKTGLESILDHDAAILERTLDGCINIQCFTEHFEVIERRPEFGRVVILVDCDVSELVNQDIHRRVYIILVQTYVNFIPFIHIVSYSTPVHPGPMNPCEDTPLPEASKPWVNNFRDIEVIQKYVVTLTNICHERRLTATAPRGDCEGHDEQSRLYNSGCHPTNLDVEKQTVHKYQ